MRGFFVPCTSSVESQNGSSSFSSLLRATFSSALLMVTFFYVVESPNYLGHAAGAGMENLHTQVKMGLPMIWLANDSHPEECHWGLWLVPLSSGKECALVQIPLFLLSVYCTCCMKTCRKKMISNGRQFQALTSMQSLSSHIPASDTSSHPACLLLHQTCLRVGSLHFRPSPPLHADFASAALSSSSPPV